MKAVCHMKTIGILTKPKFPDVKHILKDLVSWLRERQKEVLLDSKTAQLIGESGTYQKPQIAARADMLLVLGGDGTMLNAARLVEERGIPILGVNMGGLGFLTEVSVDQLYPMLEKVFAADYHLEERLMLRARIDRHGEHVAHASVLNDVVVSKGTLARMIEIQISINGQFVTRLRGDGLIVSTPTGSTAYSLSAGGPIINPSVQALILTPICPHTLTHRPLLIPSNVSLEVMLAGKDEGAMTTFDGQVGVAMTQGDTVAMNVSDHLTKLIRFPDRTYYDVLRRKLKWGDG
jgi:NAD+ kinase